MKLDTYTKIVLTVIAVCLTWICVRDINFTSPVHAQAPVQRREIVGYQLGWNVRTNVGLVTFQPTGGQAFSRRVGSVTELAGWAALLNQKPLYQNTLGWIYTGAEPVGEE